MFHYNIIKKKKRKFNAESKPRCADVRLSLFVFQKMGDL
ncbi:hypothetical protein B4168_1909 [Anoxybacillus flavithermus]|nr:hypothetical protein B4168_1909 [Anoxybacillus flavithermus]OAO85565.1 hypothetical protein GT23_2468 [Parageobacillus thermoglucosidasius]